MSGATANYTEACENCLFYNNTYLKATLGYAVEYVDTNGTGMTFGWNGWMDSLILKFTTPDFVGSTAFVKVNLLIDYCTTDVDIQYALCTSDANYVKYTASNPTTNFTVSDENQIVVGSMFCPAWNEDAYNTYGEYLDWSLSIDTHALEPNKTYYLFLWGHSTYTNDRVVPQVDFQPFGVAGSVEIGYNKGLVYLDTGSGFEAYQCYIDNGVGWDLVIPHIDNGSGWDMYT